MENNKIILDTTNKDHNNSSIILDSTRPNFTPTQKPQPQSSDTSTQTIVPPNTNEQNLQQDTYSINGEVVSPSETIRAARMFNMLLGDSSNFKPLTADLLQPGRMIFFKYDAKNKDVPYDRTPLVIILRKISSSHILGVNLAWSPIPLRIIFLQAIMKMSNNRENIKNSRPLDISYQMIKPILYKMGITPIVRLYIISRMSSKVLPIEPSDFISVAKLRTNNISGGYSPEEIYAKAISDYNKRRHYRKKKWY
jgi:hypothetical protein